MFVLFILTVMLGSLQAQNLLNGPEGLFYDHENGVYYVANALDGKIITMSNTGDQSELVSGLGITMEVLLIDDVLYVSTNDPKNLLKINPQTGEILLTVEFTFATSLSGMCYDQIAGLIYIVDQGGRLHTYNVNTEEVETVIDTGQGLAQGIQDVVLDCANNRLIICSYAYSVPLAQVDLDDYSVTGLTGTGGGNQLGITMDNYGNFYVSFWSGDQVKYYSNDFSSSGVFSTGHDQPVGLTCNYDIDMLAVANFGGNSVDLVPLYLNSTDDDELPEQGNLKLKVYPNPFNPCTNIECTLLEEQEAEFIIYNVRGEVVKILTDQYQSGNSHILSWWGEDESGKKVGSGIYILYAITQQDCYSHKLLLMK